MDPRNVPWKAEWKAAGVDPGPMTPEEEAQVEGLRRENEAFLKAHPYRPKVIRTTRWNWSVPLVAAAALVLVLGVPTLAPSSLPPTERIKGSSDPQLMVYRQSSGGSEKLVPGATVRAGDILQARYRVSTPSQGAILSVDGSRNVTVHLAQQGRSVALVSGTDRALDFSYELDRAPLFEVFFFVVADRPFDLEPIRQILKVAPLEGMKADAFGPELRFVQLKLAKENPR